MSQAVAAGPQTNQEDPTPPNPPNGVVVTGAPLAPGIVIQGTSAYASQVNADLNFASAADPYLSAMIADLRGSQYTSVIAMPTLGRGNSNKTTGTCENDSNGKGTGSLTSYDPTNNKRPDGSVRAPVVGLIHELQHAWDKIHGVLNRGINGVTGNLVCEDRAMWAENIMRPITHDDPRIKY
jgi:hypothetical protein